MKAHQPVILQRSRTDFLCLDLAHVSWIHPIASPSSDSSRILDYWTLTPACAPDLDPSPAPSASYLALGSSGFDPHSSDLELAFFPTAYLLPAVVRTPGLLSAIVPRVLLSSPRLASSQNDDRGPRASLSLSGCQTIKTCLSFTPVLWLNYRVRRLTLVTFTMLSDTE
ncbi:uncharacterized protein LOC119618079 isoform X2 [Kryptolebias marmoratus]|nr:uncharacterized protein LOC119618079 isoform X2 [Kryptolebias marmoratus]XP_037838045.1 uncharacterized protein LOC119618079 isoform X2 [Kryptolebias marmoratus]